jgi:hypothetical protein
MKTAAEIKAAIEKLSSAEQRELARRLSHRLGLDEDGYQNQLTHLNGEPLPVINADQLRPLRERD